MVTMPTVYTYNPGRKEVALMVMAVALVVLFLMFVGISFYSPVVLYFSSECPKWHRQLMDRASNKM